MSLDGKIAIGGMIGFVTFIALLFLLVVFVQGRKFNGLHTRGVMTEGTVTAITTGKGQVIQYRYETPPVPGSQSPHQTGQWSVSATTAHFIGVGDRVRVVYDAAAPWNSSLMLDGGPERLDSSGGYLAVGLLAVLAMGAPVLYVRLRFGWERRLLRFGAVAPAEIVSERPHRYKRSPICSISYQFVDAEGETITGNRDGLPLNPKQQGGLAIGMRDEFFAHPIVVYDVKNSRRNLFYPPVYARCELPRAAT